MGLFWFLGGVVVGALIQAGLRWINNGSWERDCGPE